MAPPSGTLRVGRYFLALLALVAVLYLVVFFPGNRHKPKLGIDLAGGLRVQYTAQVPKGSPSPTSDQMAQARQILEDRINSKGVSGATVVIQGGTQLVVEIPSATKTDINELGKAAVLNFRGMMAPAVPITCSPKGTATPSTVPAATSTAPASSSSGAPSSGAGSSGATSTGASTGAKSTPPASTKSGATTPAGTSTSPAGQSLHERRLTAPTPAKTPATGATTAPASGTATTGTPSTPAATGAKTSGTAAATSGAATSGATASSSSAAPLVKCTSDPFASVIKADPSLKALLAPGYNDSGLNAEECPSPDMPALQNGKPATCNAYTKLTAAQQTEILNALTNFDCNSAQDEPDIASHYYIACGSDFGETTAYLLGHVVVKGQDLDSASAQAPSVGGTTTNTNWAVSLNLTNSGGDKWSAWTGKYNTANAQGSSVPTPVYDGTATAACGPVATYKCSTWVGFTLDGQVISSPYNVQELGDTSQISPIADQTAADNLTQELNGGRLPISFRLDQSESVSATLGNSQLKAAFLAGGIGLVLVIIYSLLYYRGLGLVTISSLVVSAILTYAMLVILGQQIGFTLDLSGIAGFIVALGITADSFVVFFERIKDEVHEGRSMRVAVPRAWVRARRTILSADTVSFLAAAILYFFASADVQGFAFTLGMSTILDLVVVFLFTHPIVSLFSRSRAFGSPRFTGLNSVRTGAVIDDELPVRPARGPRTGRRAGGSATATVAPDTDTDTASDVDDAATDTADTTDTPASGASGSAAPTQPRAPRKRASGGTAAERAAERRARMREEQGDNGSNEGDQ